MRSFAARCLSTYTSPAPAHGLWVVAVPIGNLGDISDRAKSALESADVILCEDTRRTAQLLSLLQVSDFMPRLRRFDAFSRDVDRWINQVKLGRNVCVVSDAGTPAVSDPGSLLVAGAVSHGIRVTPLPGPSAVTTLLSVSGLPCDSFTFRGFYPRKEKEHEAEMGRIRGASFASIFVYFESPLRVVKSLTRVVSGLSPNASLVVAKELTKLHETVFYGRDCKEVLSKVELNVVDNGEIGEWCFAVFDPPKKTVEANDTGEWGRALTCLLRANVGVTEAAKCVALEYGVSKKEVYLEALRQKSGGTDSGE